MRVAIVMALVGVLLAGGCRKSVEEPVRRVMPVEMPEKVVFTETNETVTVEEISAQERKESVTADFNLDGLQDMAAVETMSDGSEQVTIYIQAPVRPPVASQGQAETSTRPVFEMANMLSYYRGGVIRPPTDGSIIGIMAKGGRGSHTDIILIVSGLRADNEMVHYRNDGSTFWRSVQ